MGPDSIQQPRILTEGPKGPSMFIAYTWALKEVLYPYCGAYVSTK